MPADYTERLIEVKSPVA
ncbi:unnamed protein product [Acanthoscelides obtectus]|uniref:Uncharacterized protein n=1 Tax=Acanthoscelides obtectus TaxID=200917 RepID=A0A9P0VQP5_ACAOB|nr:unnamed protein product [Acanthoscelides obtectus]